MIGCSTIADCTATTGMSAAGEPVGTKTSKGAQQQRVIKIPKATRRENLAAPRLPEGKPKKPLTAYFAFGATQREGLKELPVLEQSKAIGALWSKLSPEEKDVFTKTAEREKEAYKKDLEEWYAAHPEDKLKDEEDALAKRKKLKDKAAEPGTKVSVREPRKSKASDLMSLKLLFIVANVKKYIDENQGRVLPPTKKVKAAITAQFNSLTEEGRATWTSYLEQLDDDKKSHLKAFHDAWLKFTEV